MTQAILPHVLWLVVSGLVAAVGGLLLTSLLLKKSEREALGLVTPLGLMRLLARGKPSKSPLVEILALGNDYVVIFVLNALQDRKLWSAGRMTAELCYVAKRHKNWKVRIAALEAIALSEAKQKDQEAVRLMLIKEMKHPGMPPAQRELLEVVQTRLKRTASCNITHLT